MSYLSYVFSFLSYDMCQAFLSTQYEYDTYLGIPGCKQILLLETAFLTRVRIGFYVYGVLSLSSLQQVEMNLYYLSLRAGLLR